MNTATRRSRAARPKAELPELRKIAARSGDPRYAYGADGNARGIDPDPLTARYDLSNDVVEYAKAEAKLVAESWPKIVEELTKDGDGYQKARRAFNMLLARHGEVMFAALALRGRPEREPQPQGRRESRRSRWSWSRPRSSAKRSSSSRSRSSATSRSASRRSSTAISPRRSGTTGASSRSSGPTIRRTT